MTSFVNAPLGEKLGIEYLFAQTDEIMGRIEEDPDTQVVKEDGDLIQGDGLEEDEDPTFSHLFDDILQPPNSNLGVGYRGV